MGERRVGTVQRLRRRWFVLQSGASSKAVWVVMRVVASSVACIANEISM